MKDQIAELGGEVISCAQILSRNDGLRPAFQWAEWDCKRQRTNSEESPLPRWAIASDLADAASRQIDLPSDLGVCQPVLGRFLDGFASQTGQFDLSLLESNHGFTSQTDAANGVRLVPYRPYEFIPVHHVQKV